MNEKIIFVRTGRGEGEVLGKAAHLSKDIKRALLMVDGIATVGELTKRCSPSLRDGLQEMFVELANGGYIRDSATPVIAAKTAVELVPAKKSDSDELDFTAAYRVPSAAILAEEAAKQQAQLLAERQAREQAQMARAQVTRAKVENEAARADAEAAARELAELRANEAVEQANIKARLHAEAEARANLVAQEKIRLEAEVAQLRAEAEAVARARAVADEKARLQAEADRVQALDTAKRLANEQSEAARVKAEQAAARADAEAAARVQVERLAQSAVEMARLKAEQHAAEIKAEAEARVRASAEEKAVLQDQVAKLKAQAEAEAMARASADKRARMDADVAKLKAQHEAERLAEEVKAARLQVEHESGRAREQAEQAGQEAGRIQAETVARAVAANRAKLEAEVAQLKEQQGTDRVARVAAQDALFKAEQETARIKAVADTRARAEPAHPKVEPATINVREAAAQAKQAAESRANDESVRRAKEESKMLRAEQAAAKHKGNVAQAMQRGEAEVQKNAERLAAVVRLNARHAAMEDDVFSALDELAKQQESVELAEEIQIVQSGQGDADAAAKPVMEKRTTIATVAFFDIVGYATLNNDKQIELKEQLNQLLTNSLDPHGVNDRVILDAGEGVAIGFLQHPTDALETAMHFRNGLMANKHYDYPDLRVRTGIHLGPISLVKDMNGHVNMLGDGISSAQRVMTFANNDQIYVSRAYYDFVSSLSDEYDELFRYRGTQQDKHGRELPVYELLDAEEGGEEFQDLAVSAEVSPASLAGAATAKVPAFNFDAFDVAQFLSADHEVAKPVVRESTSVPEQLFRDVIAFTQSEQPVVEVKAPVVAKKPVAAVVKPVPVVEAVVVKPVVQPVTPAPKTVPVVAKIALEALPEAGVKAEAAKKAETPPPKIIAAQKMKVQPAERVETAVKREPKSFSPLKLGAGLFVLVLALLLVAPYVLINNGNLKSIEQMLSAKLGQPVHIGHLSGRILPSPQLSISNVSVGKQIQLHEVRADFDFSALTGAVKSIKRLELDGVQFNGADLTQVGTGMQQLAGDRLYPVAVIALTQGRLDVDGIALADLAGTLNFDKAGRFTQGSLNANANKLTLDLRAMPDQKLQLSLSMRDSALPLFPDWLFDDLKAVGELSGNELRIASMDGRIMGGVLTGDARVNWNAGWRVEGALAARVIPIQNINKLLSGDLDGNASFQMKAESVSKLVGAALLSGSFSVKKGSISGVDVVETARLRSGERQPGGITHFDELNGELTYVDESFQLKQLRMNAHLLNATGALTVAKQQLSGAVSAELTGGRVGITTLQVGGTTNSPILQAH
jgi:hypothetical protein